MITSWRELFFLSHSAFIPSFPEGLSGWKLYLQGVIRDNQSEIEPVTIQEIISRLPVRQKQFTLLCIGATDSWPAIGNAIWTGVTVLEMIHMRNLYWTVDCDYVEMRGRDGYIASIPMDGLDNLWLVWKMNGQWLSPEHGFPVRIIATSYYGTKNVKWIEKIKFISRAQHHADIFEIEGWSTDHKIRPATFIYYPDQFSIIARPAKGLNTLRITGVAYCGKQEVDRVLVTYYRVHGNNRVWETQHPGKSSENGSWIAAELVQRGTADVWSLWKIDISHDWKGVFQVSSKVQCIGGKATNETWTNDMGGWYGVSSTIFKVV
ncbi:hypothetical protein GpartN1_g3855.t1 [Galdieria partita]|uniref:Oxidoreductase molybdopterin-binding domain-containing protein n=1 Tax=Galdieria partita TaxID=83374 RepID=A0A9C7PXN6_9RHOD|nr:hypothetical protein GpartN1_g3855.t1 [Galdieria partita]